MGNHQHHHGNASGKNLKIAFFLNLGFTILEFFGGFFVNSVAILSDALHDLGDSFSLGMAWYLEKKSKQGANERFSFGYTRFSLLGALINSLMLIIGSVLVISMAVNKILDPEPPDAQGMIVFALFGIAINGYAAWKLQSGKSLNEKVVSWHLIEDVLGWVAVLIVGIVLLFREVPYLDPALSILITAYVLWNVVKRLKETLFIFLQGVPEDISIEKIKQQLLEIDKVQSLHHTHVWSLEGEHHVFSTHLKLENIREFSQILEVKQNAKAILKQYPFRHYTIETELDEEKCELLQREQHQDSSENGH